MKLMPLLFFPFFLVSCGKSAPESNSQPLVTYNVPLVTYNVPSTYYNKYKAQFDEVTADIISKTGKQLVKFVPNDDNPKYANTEEPFYNYLSTKEAWVLFKETSIEFTNIPDGVAGVSYTGSNTKPNGLIVLNFSISMDWNGNNFRQVLDHEVFHCLGFDHTFGEDFSIMNNDFTYKVSGITSLDNQRLASSFPFNLEVITIKDLEKVAAQNQREESEKYAYQLMQNFGLSETRAQSISRHLISYKKINNQRALTNSEKEMLSKEILGFGFEKGKLALEKYMQGDKESLDDLITVAANKNETSPEHIKELFGEIFLK